MTEVISCTISREDLEWCKANKVSRSAALSRGIAEIRSPDNVKEEFMFMKDDMKRMSQKLQDLALENYALRDKFEPKENRREQVSGWKSIV